MMTVFEELTFLGKLVPLKLSLAIVIVTSIIAYFYWKLTFWQRQGLPTDAASSFNRFLTPFHIADERTYKKFGKFVGTYEFFKPTLLIGEPELVKKILLKEFHKFPNHRVWGGKHNIGSTNVFRIEYGRWRPIRQVLSPALSTGKLKQMLPLMNESIKVLIENFDNLEKEGKPVDVKDYFIALSLDIIARCTYGIKLDFSQNPHNDVVTSARRIFGKNISLSAFTTFVSPKLATIFSTDIVDTHFRSYVGDVTRKLLHERKHNPMARRNDLIQLIVDAAADDQNNSNVIENRETAAADDQNNSTVIDNKETKDMKKSFDAPSIAMSSVAYCLALNPECQVKLLKEIDEFCATHSEVDYDSLNDLTYLTCVINETLRLYPPVMRTERRAIEDCEFEGLFIPKNTMVVLPAYAMQRDPDLWEDPESFIPERFLPENKHKFHPYAFIPFSGGIRNCLGIRFAMTELKLIMLRILQKYTFERCEQTKFPPEWFIGQLITTPRELVVKIKSRNNSQTINVV